ncbi:Hpt domain-containing protein [Flavobacterium sp. J372]|uniref:Hpt domain-containing protein n=1 Tax=Flavobacterium sp. J372 TaxID=2898436 RepID=UPI0027E2626E|nr:Hpt domain-containing protein [Flavobacterium sp. J372]
MSDNDPEFAEQIVALFLEEVPVEVKRLKRAMKEKDHKEVYQAAHKMKPTFDLLGMDLAYEDILTIEAWTRAVGKKKEIKEVVKTLKQRVEDTLKELKKDYNM